MATMLGYGMLRIQTPGLASHAGRGLYASDDAGCSWRAQGSWKGRYTIGLAFNPQLEASGSSSAPAACS